jgi:hypothetical protein
MVNGFGPAERDHSNGEQAAGDGRPIALKTRVRDPIPLNQSLRFIADNTRIMRLLKTFDRHY